MGRVRLCAFVAVAAVAVLALPSPASGSTPGTSPSFFGVNAAYLRDYVAPDKAATLDGLATSMGQQGISWARLTFDQSVEERTKGTFNWYVPDTMIAALARHGVRGAASFMGTAGWDADPSVASACGSRAAPYDLAGWSSWVRAAARRYGPNGTFWSQHPALPSLPIQTWEVGNEVNSGIYWCPGANPEQYAQVYSASAGAVGAVDPSGQVIVGGLAPRFGWKTATDLDVPSFLSRMTAADPTLASSIPAVAVHPYAGSAPDALQTIAKFRRAMRGAGMPDTPMIANEIGWYTQGAVGNLLVNEQQRSDLISTVANQFWRLDCGVTGLAPYSWITHEQDLTNSEDWYGLADPVTGAAHPSGLAYGQQIRLALGQGSSPPPSGTLRVCGPKTLTVQKSGSGGISSGPAGIGCGPTCSANFDDASQVTLTATPSSGYRFGGWTGCASASGNQCTVSMTDDTSVSARFVAQQTLTAQQTGSGTIASSPAGISCGATCSVALDQGTQVMLTASAASGYAFRGWSGCDSVNGIQCTVGMDSDKSVSASFVARRTLVAQRSGAGIVTSTDAGITCGPACTATLDDGTQLTLIANASPGYGFKGWTGCSSVSGDQCTVTMDSDRTVNATFAPERSLTAQTVGSGTIASSPAGIDCGSVCTARFDYASQVTLSAAPSPGHLFVGWSGCTSVSGNQCSVSMSADTTVTARFDVQRILTARKTGSGTLTSSPAGISCGSTCSAVVDDGTRLTLTASPSAGYAFRGWSGCDSVSGNQCTVGMSSDITVNASFVARHTLVAQRSGAGVITSTEAGISCGPTCTATLDDGTEVTLTAAPSSGYGFKGWTGCTSVSGNQCTVAMDSDRTVSATFGPERTLTAQRVGSGTITSSVTGIDCGSVCTARFDYASQVTLTATPSAGQAFSSWSGCTSVSGNQCTVSMSGDTTVTARFIAQQTLTVEKSGSGTVTSAPAGISCGTTCIASLDQGTQLTLTPSAADGYAFRGWSGCDAVIGNQCTVRMDSDKSVSANFVARRTLVAQRSGAGVISSPEAGISCGPTCTATVDDGTQLTLTATASPGYGFKGWTGCSSVIGDRCTVSMDSDHSVNASFGPVRSLTAQSIGSGTIASSPAGIDCGSVCTAQFDYASKVTLTATPSAGYVFRSWTGCTSVSGTQCTVSMSTDTTASARFVAQRTLTTEKSGSGTITSSPAGINCGPSCTTEVDDGTQLTLAAAPSPGYAFRGWSGCDSVDGDQCIVSMDSDKAVDASFVAQRTLTTRTSGPGTITSSPTGISCGSDCAQVVDDGTTVSLTAAPATGYRVAGWSGCDATSGESCQVTLDGDSTVAADIQPIGPPDTWISAVKIAKHAKSATLTFGGGQGTGSLSYSCGIDRRALRPCSGQAKYSIPGKHTFQVVATDELGRSDPTPATRSFRLARR